MMKQNLGKLTKGLVGLSLLLLVGSVWGSEFETQQVLKFAKQAENPFLLPVVLKQNRSVVGHSLVDRLKRRKV